MSYILNLSKEEVNRMIGLLEKDDDSNFNRNLVKKLQRSMKTIKPRSAKNKGMEWQKEVCSIISELTNIPFEQSDDLCEIHSRESGLNGTDVILRGKARELFPFDVECKNCKSLSLHEWIRQAEMNSKENDSWLLLIKSSVLSCKKIAVMNITKFEEIIKYYIRRKNK